MVFLLSCNKDPVAYSLTTSYNPSDGGTIALSTKQYNNGETASTTASFASGYVFSNWTGTTASAVMNSNKTEEVLYSDIYIFKIYLIFAGSFLLMLMLIIVVYFKKASVIANFTKSLAKFWNI